jgi:hypothetical protein
MKLFFLDSLSARGGGHRIDVTKLIVAFRNFANALKNHDIQYRLGMYVVGEGSKREKFYNLSHNGKTGDL